MGGNSLAGWQAAHPSTNLIKNATEAMDDGGIIKIKTSRNVNVNGVAFAEIMISDQGPGIPDNILSQLFQPVNTK